MYFKIEAKIDGEHLMTSVIEVSDEEATVSDVKDALLKSMGEYKMIALEDANGVLNFVNIPKEGVTTVTVQAV